MTDTLEAEVRRILLKVAPEADLTDLDADEDFREELDIDSMDYLTYVVQLSQHFGIDVPQADSGNLASLGGAVRYLRKRMG